MRKIVQTVYNLAVLECFLSGLVTIRCDRIASLEKVQGCAT